MKNTCTDELEINGTIYIKKDKQLPLAKELNGMKYVLVVSQGGGIHIGYMEKEDYRPSGKFVTLRNTRWIKYWEGAASVSQLALLGTSKPASCQISVELDSNEIGNILETIIVSEEAKNILNSVAIWKR